MSFIYILLSLLSSVIIAISLRKLEAKKRDRVVVIASNYIVSGSLGYFLADKTGLTAPLVTFGAVVGLFFFISFVIFSRALQTKGLAGTITFGRLSLAVPVAFSILLWGEKPLPLHILSLLLIFFLIILWEGKIGRVSPILLTLFILFGLLDSAMKYFKIQFPGTDDSIFLVVMFYSSMFWSWSYILLRRKKIQRVDVFAGMMVGIPNFFSTYFMLKALNHIPAYIVFPSINVGMIILSAVSGYFLFKEKLDRRKIGLIIVGIIAVLLLT